MRYIAPWDEVVTSLTKAVLFIGVCVMVEQITGKSHLVKAEPQMENDCMNNLARC